MPALGNGLRDRPEHEIDHPTPEIISLGDPRRDLIGGGIDTAPGHTVVAGGIDQPPPRQIKEGPARRPRAIQRRERLGIALDQPLGAAEGLLEADARGQDAGEDVGPRVAAEFALDDLGTRARASSGFSARARARARTSASSSFSARASASASSSFSARASASARARTRTSASSSFSARASASSSRSFSDSASA
ncbi:hypothetical protein [Catenulispora pinisilvae]|uniref:hypothetical protein n=1 Tax=Catenulispora pinisilvae TaxID=2705253 RepID=UPI001891EC7A|nr:hypothetical protein [Catenulispora pinisilvae]